MTTTPQPLQFPTRVPFVEGLGMQLLACDAGRAQVALPMSEALCNAWSVAHGGVIMSLLDVAMAMAARSPNQRGGGNMLGVVTIEMKTSFLRPGIGRLIGHGNVMHRTVTMSFCEGWIDNEAGERVAHATGTFKHLHGVPTGGRRIQRESSD